MTPRGDPEIVVASDVIVLVEERVARIAEADCAKNVGPLLGHAAKEREPVVRRTGHFQAVEVEGRLLGAGAARARQRHP